jgi:hypothetical protein
MAGQVIPLRDEEMLHGALALLKQGVAVIPLWWPENGRCACPNGATCKSPGKHPIGKLVPHGAKDASKDLDTVKRWWAAYPKANIGAATGPISGIVVVDVDGSKGQAKQAALLAEYGQVLEARNYVETGRLDGGQHEYFGYPVNMHVPTRKDDGLEVRSDGAYVVAPPSRHVSGKTYTWKNVGPLEELPKCFSDFAIQKRKLVSSGNPKRQPAGAGKKLLENDLAASYSPPEWSEAEEARIRSALTVIPADDRETGLRSEPRCIQPGGAVGPGSCSINGLDQAKAAGAPKNPTSTIRKDRTSCGRASRGDTKGGPSRWARSLHWRRNTDGKYRRQPKLQS